MPIGAAAFTTASSVAEDGAEIPIKSAASSTLSVMVRVTVTSTRSALGGVGRICAEAAAATRQKVGMMFFMTALSP